MTVRVVVVGGGYAGLAALSTLQVWMPSASLTLVDPHPTHLKLTRLHEAAARPLAELQVPFAELAPRLGFTHVRAVPGRGGDGAFDARALEACSEAGVLPVQPVVDGYGAALHVRGAPGPWGEDRGAGTAADLRELPFDYLLFTSGGQPALPAAPVDEAAHPRRVYSLADLRRMDLHGLLRERVEQAHRVGARGGLRVSVVGAGASGVQYAFELNEALRRLGAPGAVRLLDQADMPLPDMPDAVREYVADRLRAASIEWLPRTRFLGQAGETIRVAAAQGDADDERAESSALTLLLAGTVPAPFVLPTNRFGQVQLGARRLERVFAAGDCARYDAAGSDAPNAQVALRQGRLAAINLSRVYRRRELVPWVFRELGYVVSLGVMDAAGWVMLPANVVTGMPAVAIKIAVDTQYDLFLEGIDTYLI